MLTTREQAGNFRTYSPTLTTSWCTPPPRGYLLEPTKIILVVSETNFQRSERLFEGRRLTIVTGIRYLGGYLGDSKPQAKWLEERWTAGYTGSEPWRKWRTTTRIPPILACRGPATGVGLIAEHHSGPWYILPAGIHGALQGLPTGALSGGVRGHAQPENHGIYD